MVDVRFELTTNDTWSVDDAICEGISPLGYWQKVNQSPTQTKPYNTLPPFEQREGFDFGFPCLRACVVLQFAFSSSRPPRHADDTREGFDVGWSCHSAF